ncbi:MAG: ribulose-phosphate 3-epimerase [Bacillota bacterium]|jgi:ribulose-phosphate 3-epimerase|nr:ribulose-phosphate 3-epimerase [Bacillota bacterium]MDI9415416.1 ribulose-phosphate 3-epimerase [Bacillota bacterium]NLD13043.1 ribulose-phosphate 3-epimerase [Bacillota bacterium]HAV21329.1 ribulose-phosphate 3-epimerase [Bacillota bacterium]HCD41819.1 ribulose-phosphate 3-epimerase [Bacillota bacterium]
MTVRVAPSILSADFANLTESIRTVETADLLHVDVMDGHFVPNITIGQPVVRSLRKATHLPLDVHLMIDNPSLYIEDFAEAGSSIITVHAEVSCHLHRLLNSIRDAGCSPGVALCPATPAVMIEHIIHMVDLVLVMTVNPGFGGQDFIPEMVTKIRQVREMIDRTGREIDLQVDGGINDVTAPIAVQAGANVLVAGSYIFESPDPAERLQRLRAARRV